MLYKLKIQWADQGAGGQVSRPENVGCPRACPERSRRVLRFSRPGAFRTVRQLVMFSTAGYPLNRVFGRRVVVTGTKKANNKRRKQCPVRSHLFAALYHTLSSPISPSKNPRTLFVCYLYTECTYTFVFRKIFCSPIVRLLFRPLFACRGLPRHPSSPHSTLHGKIEISRFFPFVGNSLPGGAFFPYGKRKEHARDAIAAVVGVAAVFAATISGATS